MTVAFRFEGYRVLLVHNQDDLWDDVYLRFIDTACTLFAVNSAKDAMTLMSLTRFDIIIADAELPDATGMGILQSAELMNPEALKIMHQKKPNQDIRWHLILEGNDSLDQKYLEIYGLLSILSDPSPEARKRTEHYIGRIFEELQMGESVVWQ